MADLTKQSILANAIADATRAVLQRDFEALSAELAASRRIIEAQAVTIAAILATISRGRPKAEPKQPSATPAATPAAPLKPGPKPKGPPKEPERPRNVFRFWVVSLADDKENLRRSPFAPTQATLDALSAEYPAAAYAGKQLDELDRKEWAALAVPTWKEVPEEERARLKTQLAAIALEQGWGYPAPRPPIPMGEIDYCTPDEDD